MKTYTRTTTYCDSSLFDQHPFLQNIHKIIQQNLENVQLSVTFLAQKVHLSVSQLNRKLNKLANLSAGKLIRTCRINHAVLLLQEKRFSIGEIAYRIGYANSAHFCRSFKQYFGCTPSNYRARKW